MTGPLALVAPAILLCLYLDAGADAHHELQPAATADGILDAYVSALGGDAAIQRITTRIIRGRFDNGRGLRAPYVIYAKAPNKLVTLIGTDRLDGNEGSGRGYDGQVGWDKDFIGTGLRSVSGVELADLTRDADIHRPLHLRAHCPQRTVEGNVELDGGFVSIYYEDYRVVDGIRVPFRTRSLLPEAVTTFTVERVRHDEPIDDRVFTRPRQ